MRGNIAIAVLVVSILGLQWLAINELDPARSLQGVLRRVIFLSPALLVPVLVWRFPTLVGAWVIALGLLLNLIPMTLHGGLMPLAYEYVLADDHPNKPTAEDIGRAMPGSKDIILWREDIHFPALTDRFQSATFGLRPAFFSIGDAVALVGVVAAAFQIVLVNARAPLPGSTRAGEKSRSG